jgi:hypothetical protein
LAQACVEDDAALGLAVNAVSLHQICLHLLWISFCFVFQSFRQYLFKGVLIEVTYPKCCIPKLVKLWAFLCQFTQL